jgi:uncharacterized protein (TIGR02996 family)
MTPDNPFLRALLAQPDDDTLRLAMADWLDENDQPERAEFIRLQIELAAGVEDRDRRRALELRQAELLKAHDREWVRPLLEALDGKEAEDGGWSFDRGKYDARNPGHLWGGCVFRRGFAEYFHLPAPVVNRHGEKLARLTPVRELYLCPCISVNIVWLCKKPWLRSITRLRARGGRVGAHGLPDPQGDCLNADAIRALIESHHLGKLEVLDVFRGEDVSEQLAKAFRRRFGHQLVRSPHTDERGE